VFSFIGRYLDPATRLGEVLFGLIMALGFTGAVRIGWEEPDNRELFVGILGCNIAWAVVDGVMYVLGALFERARKSRLFHDVAATANDGVALQKIAAELDGPIFELTTAEEREQLHRWVLATLRQRTPKISPLRKDDLLGGVAAAFLIVFATFPIVVPYLVVQDPTIAVRISNGIAIASLFVLGWWWGRVVGRNPLRVASGLLLIGAALVATTIVLGG
jgi:hypothetical protein